MEYEVIKSDFVGAPTTNVDGVTRSWYINITSNVTGNTFSEFYHTDTTSFTFNVTDSQLQILEKKDAAAIAFVTNKYK